MMTPLAPAYPRACQAGAALLTAMLTVALVASLAAGALWHQWRSIEVEAAERARAQSLWVLTGALDWARLILREDARAGGADHLAEPWAIPLEEARLSTFLAADKNTTADLDDGASQAFLSGLITDLQSRLNVTNLVIGRKVSPANFKAFAKLFEILGLPPDELKTLTDNLQLALAAEPEQDTAPVLPQRIEQLVWLGLSPRSVAVLRPYVTLLPYPTTVNLNTASATVLYACIPGLDMAQAQRLMSVRENSHFRNLEDATRALDKTAQPLSEALYSVNSRYFEIQGRLRLDQTVVEEHSVVERTGLEVKTLWRDRGASERQNRPLQ